MSLCLYIFVKKVEKMKKNYLRLIIVSLVILLLSGCGGGGSDPVEPPPEGNISSEIPNIDTPNTDTPSSETPSVEGEENTTADVNNTTNLSFNFKNAKAIMVHNNTFDLSKFSSDMESNYTTISNLLVVDEYGISKAGLSSNLPIKVLYTVTNPDANKVYVAIDISYTNSEDGLDYQEFIRETNCTLYEVSMVDNSYKCVKQGVFVDDISNDYYKVISSDQKPIQFDADGNVYFLSSKLDNIGNYIVSSFDNPTLYRYNSLTNSSTNISQDNEYISYFSVLSGGDVVFKSYSQSGTSGLYLLQGESKIDITTTPIDFFATDSYDTLIMGDYATAGINFARSLKEGGIQKTSLDTSSFGGKPQRVIIADDGNIYGLFQEHTDDKYQAVVYQLLPYKPTAIAKIDLGVHDYYSAMSSTPLQISKGYLYYSQKVDLLFGGSSFGSSDTINIIRLSNLEKTTLLTPQTVEDNRTEIYNWRLSNGKLYFSGLEKISNKVITGLIDTYAIRDGKAPKDSISITESFSKSATQVDLAINDIEIIQPVRPESDTGHVPDITQNHFNPSNPLSISIEFSKYMDEATVLANTTLKDSQGESINYMPVWVIKSLHIIPDLDEQGNATTVPLANNQTYTLDFGNNILDAWDWEFATRSFEQTIDTTPPQLKIKANNLPNYINEAGSEEYDGVGDYTKLEIIDLGKDYNDTGAEAEDNRDGNISDKITHTSTVDINNIGIYNIIYSVSDNAGNSVSLTKIVEVADLPEIAFKDDTPLHFAKGSNIADAHHYHAFGVEAVDSVDGNLTDSIVCGLGDYLYDAIGDKIYFTGSSDGYSLDIFLGYVGSDTLTCVVKNSNGYFNSISKEIEVSEGAIFDNISNYFTTLSSQSIAIGSEFIAQSVTVTDSTDTNIALANISLFGEVDSSTAGTYTISYSITNAHGVTTTKTREVIVGD